MGKLNSLITVNISLASAAVQQKGFGRELILGASNRMGSDLFRIYTTADGLLTDGFLTTDPEYIAAVKTFSADIAPQDVMVGYAPASPVAQVEVVTVVTQTDNFNYTVTLNGESAVYLSDGNATKAEIATGLISAINALVGAGNYTAAPITGVTDRFSITSDAAGTPFTIELGTVKLSKAQFEIISVDVATDNFKYTVTVAGQAASFTSGAGTTANLIQLGLIAAINVFTPTTGVTAAAVSTDKISLVRATDEFFITELGTNKLSIVGTVLNAMGGVANGLAAIVAAGGKSWYGLSLVYTRTKADIEEAAAWIESNSYDYIFIGCSSDSDVLTNVSSDVASELKALGYLRTAYMWSDDQSHFPEAAWFGKELPTTPGSSNYAYKSLVGILPTADSVLTDSKLSIADGKNVNYYITVGGVPITLYGKMAGGQWIDVVVGRDWLKARMQERILDLLINTPKIGFDDAGIGALANVVRSVLQEGQANGVVDSFTITVPLAASFDSTTKNSRALPSIPWTAVLTGAIDSLTINGNLVP